MEHPINLIIAGVAVGVGLYAAEVTNYPLTIAESTHVVPEAGVDIPVRWGDMGKRLVEVGAIDAETFEALYRERGELPQGVEQLLRENTEGRLKITPENSALLLNLLWALGLANKNPILEDKTEMMNPAYGGEGNFASTGGWTVANGDAMQHYNRHILVSLSPDQQKLVDSVSKNIYRPCCDNSVHFPDCNHGLAMLGLLELMASQGVNEAEMYKAALDMNVYWFPDTYSTIVQYLTQNGVEWKSVEPREILSKKYSSASGYAKIVAAVEIRQGGNSSGSQCSV